MAEKTYIVRAKRRPIESSQFLEPVMFRVSAESEEEAVMAAMKLFNDNGFEAEQVYVRQAVKVLNGMSRQDVEAELQAQRDDGFYREITWN